MGLGQPERADRFMRRVLLGLGGLIPEALVGRS